jgi:sulfatase maturation enzyme AslB (radical SAM superfamily)
MELKKQTFCAAPWFQLKNWQSGEYSPCCEFDISKTKFIGKINYKWPNNQPSEYLDSPYLRYLRQQLGDGNRVPECRKCWTKEDNGLQSLRQILNDTVTKNQGKNLENTWINSYLKNKKNFNNDILLSTDVKLSNVCNFSCIMCSPIDSSQIYSIWQKNLDHPVVSEYLVKKPNYLVEIQNRYKLNSNYDLLKLLLDRCPMHLKILGGEPLLDTKMTTILNKLPDEKKSKISLLFVTNGSINLTEFAKNLVGYREINYVVSLEGIGNVQDYLRKGSQWSMIEKNIDEWNQQNRSIDVHCSLQCLNFLHLPDLLRWSSLRNLKITFGVVETPEYLSLNVIPTGLKSIIKEKIKSLNDDKFNYKEISKILDNYTYQSNLLPKFKIFLNWYDPENSWRTIFPEWKKFLSN